MSGAEGEQAEYTRLVPDPDPEAGGDPDEDECDPDSDLVSSYYDSSEEEEVEEGQEKKKKKRPPMGRWKQDLSAVTRTAIPEDKLHIVAWGAVAKHFGLNMATVVLFVFYAIVAHVPAVVALPLFMVNFLLAVTLWEYLQQCRIQIQVGSGVLVLVTLVVGTLVMGPFEFVSLCAQMMLVPLLLIIVLLRCLEKPWERVLHCTAIWQALSGHKYASLLTQLDLAKLCKGIYHSKEHTSRSMRRCKDCCKKVGLADESTVMVRMVERDGGNPEVADVPMELNGEEIEPDKFLLTRLLRREEGSASVEEMPLQDLEAALKQRKFISDKLLDTWLNPAWAEQLNAEAAAAAEKGGKKKGETRVEKVRKWIVQASFPPLGKSQMVARFRRIDFWEGVFEHWAPRAMLAVLLTAMLSFPAVKLMMQVDSERRGICSIGGPNEGNIAGPKSMAGTVICGGGEDMETCNSTCESFLSFMSALNDELQTSYVEIMLTFAFIPVYIFNLSVEMAQQEHNREELIYFRCLRASKKAITEVMNIKATLEDVFKLQFIFGRFATALRAWMGADPALSACGQISEAEFNLTASRGFNDCLKQVIEPISVIQSAISCEKSELLPYGIAYDEDDDDEEGKEQIENEWRMLKFRNGLGDGSNRNYKVLFDLVIQTEDSWNVFKDWCKKEYKKQFEHICKTMNDEVQDSGADSHLTENTPIHDIMLPKGFSLTHIYVQAMPEDGMPLQIELSGWKTGDKEFFALCDNLEHNMVKAVVDDEEEEDADEASGSVLTRRLDSYPIVARFALSEQYFNNMSSAEVRRLCGNEAAPTDFTEFVDRVMAPVKMKIPDSPEKDGKVLEMYFLTAISVFMGDESPLRAMLASLRAIIVALRVWIECFGLAMVVPILRVVMFGKRLFPEPFSLWLILNTISVWVLLVTFFQDFQRARRRLSLIAECLQVLEVKTLANAKALKKPAQKADDENAEGEGEGEEKAAEPDAGQASPTDAATAARAEKKAQEETRPFDLVIEDSATGVDYEPESDAWAALWREKLDNVRNWHASISYLRVFVSTSRLAAQTMLLVAAFICGLLLLMSLMQVANKLPTKLVAGAKNMVASKLDSALTSGAGGERRLQEQLGDAMEVLMRERFAAPHAAAAAAAGLAEPITVAARRLHEALSPARAALHGVLMDQHDTLVGAHAWMQDLQLSPAAGLRAVRRRLEAMPAGEDTAEVRQLLGMSQVTKMASSLDVTKATKTQIVTVLMVVFVLLYSVPLMWNIVLVNGYFDRHEDLLVKQKERHRLNQVKRELRKKSKTKEGEAAGEVAVEATKSEAKDKVAATGNKDSDCKRYEKTLDMGIESAKTSRERFPLKLFGFVISAQLLASWVFLAASPLVSQAKQMAPGLSVQACEYLEHSKLTQTLQTQMDITNPNMHIKVQRMLHDNVCVPLKGLMEQAMDHLPGMSQAQKNKLTAKITGSKVPARTLLATEAAGSSSLEIWSKPGAPAHELHGVPLPDLREIVQTWWRAHPAQHPEAKFATAHAALQELDRTGRRLLVAQPAAVMRAWRHHEGDSNLQSAFAAAMGAVRPELELAAEEGGAGEAGGQPSTGADRVEL